MQAPGTLLSMRGAAFVLLALAVPRAQAIDTILRPYVSPRVSAMGGTYITTGTFDDNFYGNPARIAHNPWFKVRVLDVIPMIETTIPTISLIPSILSQISNPLTALGSQVGAPVHLRIQTAFPSVFIAPREGKIPLGIHFGLTTSSEIEGVLSNAYLVDARVNSEAAFHLGFAVKFLPQQMLTLGLNTRIAYRLSAAPTMSVASLLQGGMPNILSSAGDGAHLDGDLGAIFRFPFKVASVFDLDIGASLNNVLGGTYGMLPLSLLRNGILPLAQPRQFGLGAALRAPLLSVFKDTAFALELQDLGNTGGGSLFRLIHLGAETRFRFLVGRLGLNQGYLAAGLALNFRFFTIDLSTYGEETSLNAGGGESRRFAVRAGFQLVF